MDGPLDLLLDDAGRGIEIHVSAPLRPANQRLMDSLGVRVVIVSAIAGTVRCNVGDCEWKHEGTTEECAVAGEAHRAEEHPWIRPSRYVTATGSDDALAALDAGVSQRELLDAQEVLTTRDCMAPSCDREAEKDSDYCRVCRSGSRLIGGAVVAPIDLYDPPVPEVEVDAYEFAALPEPVLPPVEPVEEEPPVPTPVGWNREGIINAIRSHNEMYGRPPKSVEWKSSENGHPSAGQVSREFGSWAAGIEAAGFARPVRGGSQKPAQAPSAASSVDERDFAGSGVSRVRTIEEDAQGASDVHWYRAWVDGLPIDKSAILAEREDLEAGIAMARQRISTLERLLGVLSEELVDPE